MLDCKDFKDTVFISLVYGAHIWSDGVREHTLDLENTDNRLELGNMCVRINTHCVCVCVCACVCVPFPGFREHMW